eukprot:scaffold179406_cov15-Tisochrysis_lutea.AAC.1
MAWGIHFLPLIQGSELGIDIVNNGVPSKNAFSTTDNAHTLFQHARRFSPLLFSGSQFTI